MSPVFSPDGSDHALPVVSLDTWAVPVLEENLQGCSRTGLGVIEQTKLLFSEIKDQRHAYGDRTADESRAGSRDLGVPPHERGMIHRSYPSPDGKRMLMVEMNERGH